MGGHCLSSSHIIVGKTSHTVLQTLRILLHFMEPFNNMKGIDVCKLVCIFNKRIDNYSLW